ncbi:MAG: hypothetical protein ACOX81_05315 [Candidatus Heteroscillospira sp.]|jgi:hypothetical protein
MKVSTLKTYDYFSKALGNRTTFLERIAAGNDESGANVMTMSDGTIAMSADTDIAENASYFFHEGLHRMAQLAPTETRDFINAVVKTTQVYGGALSSFDDARFSYIEKGQNRLRAIRFSKQLPDGKHYALEVVSRKKNQLETYTIFLDKSDYAQKKKRTAPMSLHSQDDTSKTLGGFRFYLRYVTKRGGCQ